MCEIILVTRCARRRIWSEQLQLCMHFANNHFRIDCLYHAMVRLEAPSPFHPRAPSCATAPRIGLNRSRIDERYPASRIHSSMPSNPAFPGGRKVELERDGICIDHALPVACANLKALPVHSYRNQREEILFRDPYQEIGNSMGFSEYYLVFYRLMKSIHHLHQYRKPDEL